MTKPFRTSHHKRPSYVIAGLLLLFFPFQNCSQGGFESLNSNSFSSTSETTPESTTPFEATPPPATDPTPGFYSLDPSSTSAFNSGSSSDSNDPNDLSNQTQKNSCESGQHTENNRCVANTKACFKDNAIGTQTWTGSRWGSCLVCGESFTPLFNTCVPTYDLVNNYVSFLTSCWKDGIFICEIPKSNVYIGIPNRHSGDSLVEFKFPINFTGTSAITLESKHVMLYGPGATGCRKGVSGSSSTQRIVTISHCTGTGPLQISITMGSARGLLNESLPPSSRSSAIMITNRLPNQQFSIAKDLDYPGKNGNVKFDLLYPTDYASKKNIPVVIWLHGGGWAGGNKDLDSATAEKMARLGFFVINANYTLAPSPAGVFPQTLAPASSYRIGSDDVNALVSFVKTAIVQFNGDPNKISIAGGSAGGHLALVQASRPDTPVKLKCAISLFGPTDLVSAAKNTSYPPTQYIVKSIFGFDEGTQMGASPAHQVANLNTEKVLIAHQIFDNLVPIDQALRMAANIRALKPKVLLTEFYLNSPTQQPLMNPRPEQLTHLGNEETTDGMLAYLYQECR
ncbi:alpha/beta hydrolase [Bdellovibrio sp.]|uniref:alpha/beta hydrolase n=1 Tax=Bdellovibrio sp. TaxID=28201 RepID=UPI0039E32D98